MRISASEASLKWRYKCCTVVGRLGRLYLDVPRKLVHKWFINGLSPIRNGVYWGYNPLTLDPNFQQDIQVWQALFQRGGIRASLMILDIR